MKLEICYMKCSKTIKTLFSLNICWTMIIFLLLLRLFLMWKRRRRFCWSEFGDWRTKIRIVCYLGEKKKRLVKLVKSTWYDPTNAFCHFLRIWKPTYIPSFYIIFQIVLVHTLFFLMSQKISFWYFWPLVTHFTK